MITEIFVEGKRLDLTADISSLLTFALDDVKNFASRQTTFSKTVVLPGTANNNAIFGNIFEIGSSNEYDPALDNIGYNFNASKSAACIIFQDNLQTFKGTLRILEIDKDKGRLEYEVALNGDLTTLNVALSGGLLEDLDFSAYDDIYSVANIEASWDNPGGSGVYYPLVDYGNYSVSKHNWDERTFRPALYAKEYLDKMFEAAGFRYECPLFDTPRFKSLIIPHNQKVLLGLSSLLLTANAVTPYTIIASAGAHPANLRWETWSTTVFTVAPATRFTYTGLTPVTVNITWDLKGNRQAANPGWQMYLSIRRNGADIPGTSQTFTAPPFPVGYSYFGTTTISLATGDYLEWFYDTNAIGAYTVTADRCNVIIETDVPTLVPVGNGDTVQINQTIPRNIRQVDFLLSIVQLFNLYVYEDKWDDRLIKISPFIDFYSTTSNDAVDWTYKCDRDQVIKIKPMSEINAKIYNFNYKDDADYYNDLYKKRYNQGYGSYIFDSEFEFADESSKLELVFASTPLVGYLGEDKVYPTIFKLNNNVEENLDSVIRIMQSKKINGVSPWQILGTGGSPLGSYTKYGYAGHLDDPATPANDLNFGALNELFFKLVSGDLSQTQFNVYWSTYMAEITDKDSKMLTAKFYLTPKDIFNLDFSKFVFLDGVLFRLNKITDYNVSQPSTCTVELLRVINTAYAFTPPIPTETFYWIDFDGSFVVDSDSSKIPVQ